jgi:tRNA (guanine37-N1)-methyltransferase
VRVDVVTLFPEIIHDFCRHGIPRIAMHRGLLDIGTWNPRDYSIDGRRSVDDRPYGGGPGMVLTVQPVSDAVRAARSKGAGPVLYLTPQGERLDQRAVQRFASLDHVILLAGRYEGIDERAIDREVDEEWSIGDYVLSGGEPAALVWIDAVIRLIPGVLGRLESAEQDSFMGGLLDYPHFTRPETVDGHEVPAVLRGGNHEQIKRWRLKQSIGRTWLRRPDLLEKLRLSDEQKALLAEFIREQKTS